MFAYATQFYCRLQCHKHWYWNNSQDSIDEHPRSRSLPAPSLRPNYQDVTKKPVRPRSFNLALQHTDRYKGSLQFAIRCHPLGVISSTNEFAADEDPRNASPSRQLQEVVLDGVAIAPLVQLMTQPKKNDQPRLITNFPLARHRREETQLRDQQTVEAAGEVAGAGAAPPPRRTARGRGGTAGRAWPSCSTGSSSC